MGGCFCFFPCHCEHPFNPISIQIEQLQLQLQDEEEGGGRGKKQKQEGRSFISKGALEIPQGLADYTTSHPLEGMLHFVVCMMAIHAFVVGLPACLPATLCKSQHRGYCKLKHSPLN